MGHRGDNANSLYRSNSFSSLGPGRSQLQSFRSVHFNAQQRRFDLLCRTCQYSFRVDEHGWLEHLYWGVRLQPDDDLDFLRHTNISLPFDPIPEKAETFKPHIFVVSDILKRQSRDSNRNTWKAATMMQRHHYNEEASRLENACWRLLAMKQRRLLREREMAEGEGPQMNTTAFIPMTEDERALLFEEAVAKLMNDIADTRLKAASAKKDAWEVREPGAVKQQGEEQTSMSRIPPGLERVGRNTKLLEFSDYGTGDYRIPSFRVMYADGSHISPMLYKTHRVMLGVVPMGCGMPIVGDEFSVQTDAATLIVTLADPFTDLEVDLHYTVYEDFDIIVRRTVIRNKAPRGAGGVTVLKLASATVDFESDAYHFLHLPGEWAAERQVTVQPIVEGYRGVDSRRGTSSHQHNPFAVIARGDTPPEEDRGEVYGFALMYSGNHRIEVEKTETGRVRLNIGINPDHFSWSLASGGSLESPECIMAYSSDGLTYMSQQLHKLIRTHVIPQEFRGNWVCPILLNTWEAFYFQQTHDNIMQIAKEAKEIGVELLVVDDGWFGRRDDEYTSLGDWDVDFRKLPKGLKALVDEVNGLGLKFGIWVEPEMISVQSKLYEAKPEWALGQAGKSRSEGRNQLVLDFTRKDVRDYIYRKLEAILMSANIEYVKWDCNRHLTEVYSRQLSPAKQGEVFHRYVLGVYEVFRMLRARFPHVIIENCAGGGGRFDVAMLKYSPQIWCSDNTDALSRIRIQYGTSLAYPISAIGSHVSTVPNHQTFRHTPLKTRFVVALCGTFGYELDLTKEISAVEKEQLKAMNRLRTRLAPIIFQGDFYRLWNPFDSSSSVAAWMFVTPDRLKALVFAFISFKKSPGRYLPRLRLRGLDPDEKYTVSELVPTTIRRITSVQFAEDPHRPVYQFGKPTIEISGKALLNCGLPIKLEFDGDSCLFEITAHTHIASTQVVLPPGGASSPVLNKRKSRDGPGTTLLALLEEQEIPRSVSSRAVV